MFSGWLKLHTQDHFDLEELTWLKLRICETVLRDGHQSILATRMRYEQMEPVLGLLDEIGYEALECWGGATYDSCLRFLNEDPWERLAKLKANVKNTPLQMLLSWPKLIGLQTLL